MNDNVVAGLCFVGIFVDLAVLVVYGTMIANYIVVLLALVGLLCYTVPLLKFAALARRIREAASDDIETL